MLRPKYFHNTLTANHKWQIVISNNLDLQLKLFFCQNIITNYNLSLRNYCKSVVDIISLKIKII